MNILRTCVLALLVLCVSSQNITDVSNLLTKLFITDAYNAEIRPVVNQTHPIFIYLDFYMTSVIEFNEQDESLKTSGYLAAFWTDENLQWDPADYNNVTELFIPQEKIWKPDLSLRNTFVTFKGLGSSYLYVLVTHTGNVAWFPFQVLQSTCAVNIRYFPFDTQSCNMKFTAWSYTKEEILLYKGTKGVMMEDYSPNAAWDLISSSAEEVNTDEAAVVFTLNLKRKPLFFLINIISPVILLSLLNVCTFLLPVESGEKAGFSVTVFLSLAVFLTIIADQLPNNSDRVSLMAVYLSMMTGLSTFVVVVSLIQIRLSIRKEFEHPVTGVYVCLLTLASCIGCKICKKKPHIVKPLKTNEKDSIDFEDESQDGTWSDVINAMDFLCFWISILYTFFVTTILACVAVVNA